MAISLGDEIRMSSFDPTHDLTHEPKPTVVRRLEVITGIGGRRKWSVDAKAEIMLEALAPGATVSEVARRHDLRPQQVFGWLREARKAGQPAPAPAFVSVVVEPEAPAAPTPKKRRKPRAGGGIEIEIDGVVVRIDRGAEAKTIAAVIQALKAGQ
ncbi:transposase [Phenylobacterium sp. LjRoot225]|uniref:IS66-like element accessory protein TnpA n=1 Tax=Phenylobacterium sp. LjRoot225 TaxID=3342285 RepID=UPI003ECC223A